MPIGRLMKKIQRQERVSVSRPPSTSPTAPPPAAIALQTPSAWVRSRPSANVVVTIESAAGETRAAPSPCSARPPTSIPDEVATPLTREAAENKATPAMKRRCLPSRSAARPPRSRNPPKTSVYAFTIHWRLVGEKCSPRWIEGSATFTIVASRMTMNCAMQTSPRTSHLFTCRASAGMEGDNELPEGCIPGPASEVSPDGRPPPPATLSRGPSTLPVRGPRRRCGRHEGPAPRSARDGTTGSPRGTSRRHARRRTRRTSAAERSPA